MLVAAAPGKLAILPVATLGVEAETLLMEVMVAIRLVARKFSTDCDPFNKITVTDSL